jgi:hypothetical protein
MTAHPILLKLVAEAVREAKAAGFTTDSDIASYMTNKKMGLRQDQHRDVVL